MYYIWILVNVHRSSIHRFRHTAVNTLFLFDRIRPVGPSWKRAVCINQPKHYVRCNVVAAWGEVWCLEIFSVSKSCVIWLSFYGNYVFSYASIYIVLYTRCYFVQGSLYLTAPCVLSRYLTDWRRSSGTVPSPKQPSPLLQFFHPQCHDPFPKRFLFRHSSQNRPCHLVLHVVVQPRQ